MKKPKKNDFAPYDLVTPGFEVVYTGETEIPKTDQSDSLFSFAQDKSGNVFMKYSSWGFARVKEKDWDAEINAINRMQKDLGVLGNDTRKIRAQISSLQCCDNGVPVTIDEILNAIGIGKLPQPAFHPGCWLSMGTRPTQHCDVESMCIIEKVLKGYLAGNAKENFINKYPYAKGFISRTYEWIGPVEKISELQKLMLERILLPFDFLTKWNEDHQAVHEICFGESGKGAELDEKISNQAGLPKIFANYKPEFQENLKKINDTEKQELYKICGAIAHGLHGLSDCHHSTFRWIESWIYSVGKFSLEIPTRTKGSEGQRLGQLLFGYALGLDLWLRNFPMQFALLDLAHINPGFDPKNEILRVYAYLGEKNPVKEWLAACLWYKFVLEPPASLYNWGWRHKELLESESKKGITVRRWMNSMLNVI